ncbi:mitochondrial trifunctional enzyme 3-ketoacyl-CoA thiolase--acetyl-CoA acyltransferase--beta-ketothiolase subunit b [Andalucia godoyi]|uniref:Mitochondrial trifunctional enzyme 3-ketoacyl-CoA thiolase--acetyl-CoA acyltransferase--beta-ketothiolase subunit b n=1 Tax=Andalucia godoyi TaxID=505711 RepID=A0A8K0AGR5_ANDGO|nr:mitochondrial trifunctional enzyme 3-ketoacyl-CoA thiolase--acetyl-CoA acyltransferase--beta-ketothiolase subunit b [Andalucia godoyi]|eukprot:ANDGO_01819.mRNA.1 mitochondrial trifunctional enzyme 3-ketoacyl-CoA thiolase--acetyl-CoA acyltransferase--beta-ketothiolase subunit b
MSESESAHRRIAVLSSHLASGSLSEPQAAASFVGSSSKRPQRAVIVGGVRTPFRKAFSDVMHLTSIDLGVHSVRGLLHKYREKLPATAVDEIIWGNVVLNTAAPNIAREIVVDLNLPPHIHGVTVSRACLSGLEAIELAVSRIEHGDADVVIAGGSDSMSNGELPLPRHLTHALAMLQYAGKSQSPIAKVISFFKMAGSPLSWMPSPPQIAERSTGKKMGYHADLMAEINGISRSAQDAFALSSHAKAAAAQKHGYLAEEIVPVPSARNPAQLLSEDNIVRKDALTNGPEISGKMSKLRPCFRSGAEASVTAATSSPLTDGGSAVLVVSEAKAKALGLPTDIRLVAFINCAVDPYPQLLLAPALAIPRALFDAGLTLDDIDIFELHEAFAAQVLCTVAVLANEEFCAKRIPQEYLPAGKKVIGKIPLEKINPCGSSIAIGHPFAATGGRLVASASNQLRRTGKRYALLSVCAAGGMGGVAIIERVEEK